MKEFAISFTENAKNKSINIKGGIPELEKGIRRELTEVCEENSIQLKNIAFHTYVTKDQVGDDVVFFCKPSPDNEDMVIVDKKL